MDPVGMTHNFDGCLENWSCCLHLIKMAWNWSRCRVAEVSRSVFFSSFGKRILTLPSFWWYKNVMSAIYEQYGPKRRTAQHVFLMNEFLFIEDTHTEFVTNSKVLTTELNMERCVNNWQSANMCSIAKIRRNTCHAIDFAWFFQSFRSFIRNFSDTFYPLLIQTTTSNVRQHIENEVSVQHYRVQLANSAGIQVLLSIVHELLKKSTSENDKWWKT